MENAHNVMSIFQFIKPKRYKKTIVITVTQVLALEKGLELYTKNEISQTFPSLKSVMNRKTLSDFQTPCLFLFQLLELSEERVEEGIIRDFEYVYIDNSKKPSK
ncbi:MAG: hypothetical protein ACJAWV_003960 [Flammeovirgaceae bacterium]|jgi:hypothetical protein